MPREFLPRAPSAYAWSTRARFQHGASERMVVSPGHEADAILHLPGGNPGTPCHRTIATSTAIGWKGGRCPGR